MTDFVLVHGAFHGGWCWRRVADRLRAAGHRVVCPTLTGLGDRRHLLSAAVDLDTHVEDIVAAAEAEEVEGAVLACHSYGGMPGAMAAERLAGRLAALVWLDAYLPEDGRSMFAIREAHGGGPPLAAPDGLTIAPPPVAAFGLAGEDAAWVARRMTPHPVATCSLPARITGALHRVPSKLHIRATRYGAGFLDHAQSVAAANGWRTQREDLPHDMMVALPDWTAAALEAAVAR